MIKIWLEKPPTGTGVSISKVRPYAPSSMLGEMPFNVWLCGAIVRFCATPEAAFGALEEELK